MQNNFTVVTLQIKCSIRSVCIHFFQKNIEDIRGFTATTALKINMEHNHGGLEDHFPFKMGDL